jgi:catechol 2,3-dioxygenase-like lactoylglutathione lyase family enzyme
MRIHHIAMRTTRIDALERFYVGVLGLKAVRRDGERSVWLSAGDALVMLERAEDGEPAVPRGSMELVAFAVDASEMPERRRVLARAGIVVEARTAFTIYFRDPDGRRVALSHYAMEAETTARG